MRLALAALWFAPLMWSAKPVWIDTDPSAIPGGHEVDDAFALLQAFGSPELSIRGIRIAKDDTDTSNRKLRGTECVEQCERIVHLVTAGNSGRVSVDPNGCSGPHQLSKPQYGEN